MNRGTPILGNPKESVYYLVGGLEHFLFSHILGIIIPIDVHIFQRGGPTTNQLWHPWHPCGSPAGRFGIRFYPFGIPKGLFSLLNPSCSWGWLIDLLPDVARIRQGILAMVRNWISSCLNMSQPMCSLWHSKPQSQPPDYQVTHKAFWNSWNVLDLFIFEPSEGGEKYALFNTRGWDYSHLLYDLQWSNHIKWYQYNINKIK